MTLIAIDIVLLPPDDIMDQLVSLSKSLSEQTGDNSIELHKQKCVPHISLAMGYIDDKDLPELKKSIEFLDMNTKQLKLEFTGINQNQVKDTYSSEILVSKTPELTALFQRTNTILRKFHKTDATHFAFYNLKDENEVTVRWVNQYPEKNKDVSAFRPHITIGMGSLDKDADFPKYSFTAKKIAICHLGNFCTCRKVLFTMNLV